MQTIAFLVSGNGGNLKFFSQIIGDGLIENTQLAVVADRECGALECFRNTDVVTRKIDYTRQSPGQLRTALADLNPSVVVTNWNKIIDRESVDLYEGKMINLHYSLLPSFAGLTGTRPLKLAYERGCRWVGPTCHYVSAEVDAGKIIAQYPFAADVPLANAIQLMFRRGCMALLTGVQQVLGSLELNWYGTRLVCSPTYPSIEVLEDEALWKKVALL